MNEEIGLKHFKESLLKLKQSNEQKVIITHIGDSHIQADLFSGKMRRNFQNEFGNGGRGLVFPYQAAKTNGPWDYIFKDESKSKWEAKRNIFINNPIPIGVCGITIKTEDTSSVLSFQCRNDERMNYDNRFDKLTLFHEKGNNTFDYIVYDGNGSIMGFLNAHLNKPNYCQSTLLLDTLTDCFSMKCYMRDTLQVKTEIYGLYLENSSPGIIYNTIGVNGAEYRHYNASQKFIEQLKLVNSNLIIVSLGTNDAVPVNFSLDIFMNHVDTLIQSIKQSHPNTSILITSPGDFYRKKKYKNKNVPKISEALKEYSLKNNLAYWDWFKVMGGSGSVLKFTQKHLAQPDRLHLTRSGYELQADLLYEAFRKLTAGTK